MLSRLVLATGSVLLFACFAAPGRGGEPEDTNKALDVLTKKAMEVQRRNTWTIARVQADADGAFGSILVTRSKPGGIETESMWLPIRKDTPFTINGRAEGARVKDLTEGMSVTFEAGGAALTYPPQAVGVTAVHVSGQPAVDLEALLKRAKAAPPKPD